MKRSDRNPFFVEVPGSTPSARFENAVRQIVQVSHDDMRQRIAAAKQERADRVQTRERLLARRKAAVSDVLTAFPIKRLN
jgi:hypothetical protein